MKVLFIEPHLQCVGGIRRIVEVSNRLVSFGHQVHICTPTGTPCRWLLAKAHVYKISKIQGAKFDVVVFNLAEQYKVALGVKAKHRVFWVLAPEAMYKDPGIPIQALQQNFFFIANSKFTSNYIRQHRKLDYGIPITPGGVNPEHFRYDPDCPKTHHILYYGSKRPWKGTRIIETALSTTGLKILRMEGRNTPQKDLWKLYNGANCFVSACQCEGFSMPELEAMYCGCPVICTNSGGNMDYVNYSNAILVDRNVTAINKAVHRLLANKTLARNLRVEGRKTAMNKKYNWDNITKKFELILKKLLAGQRV